MRTRTLLAVPGLAALLFLASLGARAQDDKKDEKKAEPKAALPPDVVPSTYRMYLVSDKRFEPLKDAENKLLKGPDGKDVPNPKNRQDKIHCLVCEYGLNPVVAVFVRADAKALAADTGVGKLTKGIDALIAKNRADKVAGFVAFLRLESGTKTVTVKTKGPGGTEVEEKVEQYLEYPDDEKRDEYAKDIRMLSDAVNAPNVPFGLAAEKSPANSAWKINDTDEVTVVYYYRMRIIGKPWAFAKAADLTDEKIAEILKTIETKVTGRK